MMVFEVVVQFLILPQMLKPVAAQLCWELFKFAKEPLM